jgi:hypothetical protein
MEDSAVSTTPELTVKLWPITVIAKGTRAIDAVERAVRFALYARAVGAIILAIGVLVGGHELAPWALRLLKFW